MKFDDFDKKMRSYEESLDQIIPEDIYIVARLDGRSFTKLTKETVGFDAPFDERFRNLMVDTTKYLIENSGFQILYGYTQSDEISLLFKKTDNTFGRKVRKINTTLAAEASVAFNKFYQNLHGVPSGIMATFDCRVIPLPNLEKVKDYFLWRQEDSNRNALNGWCYWTLRKEGSSARAATKTLSGKGNSFKTELLFERGINYKNLPSWQKNGVGLNVAEVEKIGFNPMRNESVSTKRRQLVINYDLPIHSKYGEFIETLVNKEGPIPVKEENEDYER